MHLLLSEANGFVENQPYDIQQTPGDIVILSYAVSELTAAAAAMQKLSQVELDTDSNSKVRPKLRLMHLGYLGHPATIDAYMEILRHAKIIVVRLLGGKNYWDYGCCELYALCKQHRIQLILLSGDHHWDQELARLSLSDSGLMKQIFAYFCAGGVGNLQNCLALMAHRIGFGYDFVPPQDMADSGILKNWQAKKISGKNLKANGKICILFYRALLHSGDVAPIEMLAQQASEVGLSGIAFYLSNFKDQKILTTLAQMLAQEKPDLIILTTGFTLQKSSDGMSPQIFAQQNVPLLQVTLSSLPYDVWLAQQSGLPAREIAMNIALTEIDGRIFTRAIAFQSKMQIEPLTQCPLSRYYVVPDRVQFVAELAARWVKLQKIPQNQKKLGFVLGNYPASDGRLANGVGLDTPDAVVSLLREAQKSGVLCDLPADSQTLMDLFSVGVTNQNPQRSHSQARLELPDYQKILAKLPEILQQKLAQQWGNPAQDPFVQGNAFHLPFILLGNVAVGLQIARGYDLDPDAYCHDPALVPPHGYLAFYFWLIHDFKIDCLVHIGKHGTLEWLPGKALALSRLCWTDAILGAMPVIYPFIANDPGEGTQAKRRMQSVILDHLPPCMQMSGLYGDLADLENLMDEYYEARHLDSRRKKWLENEMLRLSQSMNLEIGVHKEIDVPRDPTAIMDSLNAIETWLCDLKFTMIRAGLHRYGQLPQRLDEMLLALLRYKRGEAPYQQSLLQVLATELHIDFNPLESDAMQGEAVLSQNFSQFVWPKLQQETLLQETLSQEILSRRKIAEMLENYALSLLAEQQSLPKIFTETKIILDYAKQQLKPLLADSVQRELSSFVQAIDGKFIAPGPSGAPSRGRLDVLPTGRNFFSVDIRGLPTLAAWQLGQESANLLLQEHLQNHGVALTKLVLSMWGTAQMRTGGEDIAQAMALMGVRPIRNYNRVTGFEVIPLELLGRERVDVTLRISGFFRDAFPNIIMQLAQMVQALAKRDEDVKQNPLRAQYLQEQEQNLADGFNPEMADLYARQRIFGSAPGTYGAGLQHLLANGNWQNDADFAKIFLSWGGYAYDGEQMQGAQVPELLQKRLMQVQAVVQNQDNREHDILDSDDYYQFTGGLAASVRYFSGQQAEIYLNDHSNPDVPKIGTLAQEIARIVRARAANPKWIASIMEHGYKGAFEISATVEYLFAFAATTELVQEHQFDSLFQAYLEDVQVREFMAKYNPQALADMTARFQEAITRQLWVPRRNSVQQMLAESENIGKEFAKK